MMLPLSLTLLWPQAKVKELTLKMGGEFSGAFTADVTHLVADAVVSAKYKYAAKLGTIHCVTARWIFDCYDHQKMVSIEGRYKLAPFAGLTICATGISRGKQPV